MASQVPADGTSAGVDAAPSSSVAEALPLPKIEDNANGHATATVATVHIKFAEEPSRTQQKDADTASRAQQEDADSGSLVSANGNVGSKTAQIGEGGEGGGLGKGAGERAAVPSGETELQVTKQRAERPTSIVPPFWQHARQASRISVASSLGSTGIRMEDNTQDEQGDERVSEENASGLKSPLWARQVDIDDYVRVEGDIKGVGGYTVWLIRVHTLDSPGSSIVLRKRYSEFEALRRTLDATFPNAGSSLPGLPPKSAFYKFRPSFLEKRRIGLKYFLNCILLNPEFAGSPAVTTFIFS